MVEGLSQRLAREFKEKIAKGEWTVGVRLPTTRELAATYQVSVNTIQSAFRELEANDLVERRPRLGGFVKPRAVPNHQPHTRTATTIGVIGPYTDAGYQAHETWWGYRIIRGCDQEISPAGFHVSMFSYDEQDPDRLTKVRDRIENAGNTLAGCLIFVSPGGVGSLLPDLDDRNTPWVTVNRPREHAAQNFVSHDAFAAARTLGRCFAKMDYSRVAVLSDRLGGGRSSRDKYFGFIEGWIEAGRATRDVDFLSIDGFEEVKGHAHFTTYLKQHGPPRAVFASGDLLALGAMRACREQNLSIPDDVAVVGATGLQLAAYAHPPLTVLDTPMERIGAEAGQMLLVMAREGVRRMIGRYVPTDIVVRESCPIPADLMSKERAAVEQSP